MGVGATRAYLVPPSNRNLLFIGDSLTLEPGYPNDVMAMMPVGTTHTTIAVGGAGTEIIYGASSATIALATWTDIIILAGINDVGLGDTALNSYYWLSKMYNEAYGARARLTGVMMLPWGNSAFWTAPRQAQFDLLNGYINEAITPWAVANTSVMGAAGKLLPAYDIGDGVHLTPAGKQKLADLVYAALQ